MMQSGAYGNWDRPGETGIYNVCGWKLEIYGYGDYGSRSFIYGGVVCDSEMLPIQRGNGRMKTWPS